MNYIWAYISVAVLMLACVLLIFIVLLQRGRGGGLAGAFGGAGGQSALGTKAGDVFTKITVGLAVFWVFLACISIYVLRASSEGRISLGEGSTGAAAAPGVAPAEDDFDLELPGDADRLLGATGAGTTRTDVEASPPRGEVDESDGGPALGGSDGNSSDSTNPAAP